MVRRSTTKYKFIIYSQIHRQIQRQDWYDAQAQDTGKKHGVIQKDKHKDKYKYKQEIQGYQKRQTQIKTIKAVLCRFRKLKV